MRNLDGDLTIEQIEVQASICGNDECTGATDQPSDPTVDWSALTVEAPLKVRLRLGR